MKLLREYIRGLISEANEYSWNISNKKNLMLDKEALEKEDRENQYHYLKSMGLVESRFKQMFKKKFTNLRKHIQNSSFLSADPAGDGDYNDWSSEASEVLRNDLNNYFDSVFSPGYLTAIVKVSLLPEDAEDITKDDILKGAVYEFRDGLHFIEVILASIDDGSTISSVPGSDDKIYEVISHELLHMQQFLKFSKGKPTDKLWREFIKDYSEKGGPSGMGEDYFYYDKIDGASELETFSFQIANELLASLGKSKAIKNINNNNLNNLRNNSASFRDIESRSKIDRPEFKEMLRRTKQYLKLS